MEKDAYGKMMELIHQEKKIPRIDPPIRRWEVRADRTVFRDDVTIRNVRLED